MRITFEALVKKHSMSKSDTRNNRKNHLYIHHGIHGHEVNNNGTKLYFNIQHYSLRAVVIYR